MKLITECSPLLQGRVFVFQFLTQREPNAKQNLICKTIWFFYRYWWFTRIEPCLTAFHTVSVFYRLLIVDFYTADWKKYSITQYTPISSRHFKMLYKVTLNSFASFCCVFLCCWEVSKSCSKLSLSLSHFQDVVCWLNQYQPF